MKKRGWAVEETEAKHRTLSLKFKSGAHAGAYTRREFLKKEDKVTRFGEVKGLAGIEVEVKTVNGILKSPVNVEEDNIALKMVKKINGAIFKEK